MNSRRMIVPSKKVGEMGTGRSVTALRLSADRREILARWAHWPQTVQTLALRPCGCRP